MGEACRSLGLTEQTYYRWRKEYEGLKMDRAKRLKEVEQENTRLREQVAPVGDEAKATTPPRTRVRLSPG